MGEKFLVEIKGIFLDKENLIKTNCQYNNSEKLVSPLKWGKNIKMSAITTSVQTRTVNQCSKIRKWKILL